MVLALFEKENKMEVITKTFETRDSNGNEQILIVNQKKKKSGKYKDLSEHLITHHSDKNCAGIEVN